MRGHADMCMLVVRELIESNDGVYSSHYTYWSEHARNSSLYKWILPIHDGVTAK